MLVFKGKAKQNKEFPSDCQKEIVDNSAEIGKDEAADPEEDDSSGDDRALEEEFEPEK